MKLPPIDWPAIDKFDLRVIPLRGEGDDCEKLRHALYKQTTRYSYIDGEPRDFRIVAAPVEAACVILRIQ